MPNRPQSPLQTHSAPPLPLPAEFSGGPPTFDVSRLGRRESENTRSGSNAERTAEKENGVLWGLPSKYGTGSFSQESHLERPIDQPQSFEACFNRRGVMPHAPIEKKADIRYYTGLGHDAMMGTNLHVTSSRKATQGRTMAATNPPEWVEEQHALPVSLTPTAYEAALARYGKKLLSMTQKEIQEKQQNRIESLSRRKAVNQRYSELSRPPVGIGRSAQLALTTHRENSSNRSHGRSSLYQKGEAKSVIGNGDKSCDYVSAGVGLLVTESQGDVLDAIAFRDCPRRELSFALDEDSVTTRVLPTTESRTDPTQRNKRRKKAYRKDGLQNDMKTPSLAVRLCTDLGDVCGKSCSMGGYRSNSVGNVGAHDATGQKKTTATTRTIIKLKSGADPSSFKAPLTEEPHISSSHDVIHKANNFVDDFHFISPPLLTPPRPLRRMCASESCYSSVCYGTKPSRHALRSEFVEFVNTQRFYDDPWRRTPSTTGPYCTYSSYSRSRSLNDLPSERCTAGQQALVFIRPQEKPRPLPRRSETAVRSDEDLWSVREASFRGCVSSEENHRCRGRGKGHFIEAFTSTADSMGGLGRNTGGPCHENERIGEGRRCVFTVVVPRFVLDGFAQRCLLRLAWRRWKRKARGQ